MRHLPTYHLQAPLRLFKFPFYYTYPPYTQASVVKRVRHHIDYASHLLGRNVTPEEGEVLASLCEQAIGLKPLAMFYTTVIGQNLMFVTRRMVGRQPPVRTSSSLVLFATLGWIWGDLFSFRALRAAEYANPTLSSLRACDMKDTMFMAWEATSLWKGRTAVGPDDLGVYGWKRYMEKYMRRFSQPPMAPLP